MPSSKKKSRTKGDEAEESQNSDSSLALVQQLLRQMKEDREQMQEQMREEREQMQGQMQRFMTDTMDKLTLDRDGGNRARPDRGTRSKRIDAPILGPVESTGIADYRTWRESFEGYSNVMKLKDESDLRGSRTMTESAISPTSAKLGTTGMRGS